ncbi:NAD(P)/FAD-dependent oxidoreductase [Mucilaginibacter sp.]|jgi:NADH dehydrogenase|uniref:NAD(P)/FAD-dependent oxidoreductase n=1 Tax=Mucilaginibacter sp. TaxID=1882438 RepID=UPI00356653CA
MIIDQDSKPIKVVIAGGGFAGVNLAEKLLKDKRFTITIIDRNNYNYFPPLLYQVATGFLDPSSISYPYRKLFRNERIAYRMAEVSGVSPGAKILYLDNGQVTFDYLVFASGVKSNFFGIDSIAQNAIPMKTVDDALRMRNILYKTMEEASVAVSDVERQTLLNIVVAGGGPTGVEVTGMIAEIKKNIFLKEYPELKNIESKIYIVDGGKSLLGPMSDKSHDDAFKVLSGLGVEIILNTHVSDFRDRQVKLSTGEIIPAKVLIWAAGVTADIYQGIPESCIGPGKRIIVDRFNKIKDTEHIYAIGDCSIILEDTVYSKGHPQLAQVAIQQGRNLAANFSLAAKGKPINPFIYVDKGEMAIIGREHAVVDLFKHRFHLRGFIALFAWLAVHLVSLVNAANKFRTLFSWIVAYLSKDQSLRMIYRPESAQESVRKTGA